MSEPRFPTKLPETDDGTILFSVPFPAELNAETLAALKEMAPIIIKHPYHVDYVHSYGQDSPWFAGVANKKLLATKCPKCPECKCPECKCPECKCPECKCPGGKGPAEPTKGASGGGAPPPRDSPRPNPSR